MTGLRERNKIKRREAILDATVSLLREKEFGDVTIEAVAQLAEVSPHTVYNLVGTRDELAYALMGRVVRHMARTAPLPDGVPEDPSEGLRAITDHALDALTAEPAAYRSIVRAVSSLPHWPTDQREPFIVYEKAARLLDQGGVLRTGVSHRVVSRHTILGMFGSMMAWARGQSDERFRDDARLNLALVLASTTTGDVHERAVLDVERLAPTVSPQLR
ncbi:TetR/AcrR family transcriptional regulator [Acidimicrobiia bacterium EGI L10123]|uniref:TetR/AcrR family transcriptional regulator n=1 Tax=Salinilacustrithrix flava TaxID=2957203 RepID=UPI003D7C2759|nr:TetR/AcrR family transcriptional regulator [Acidimicrobiia bacterium EGI L10123]